MVVVVVVALVCSYAWWLVMGLELWFWTYSCEGCCGGVVAVVFVVADVTVTLIVVIVNYQRSCL